MKAMLGKLYAQYPSLNYAGLALWLGWSTAAFSRAFEFYDFDPTSNAVGLFAFIQIGSLVVFAIAALFPRRVATTLLSVRGQFVAAGAVSVSVAATMLSYWIAAHEGMPSELHAAIYSVASIATGCGTATLFLKCIVPFCSQAPKRATLRFAQTLFQSGLYYFLVIGSPRVFSLTLLCLTPLGIAVLQAKARSGPKDEHEGQPSRIDRPFFRLLAAMMIYAISMRVFEPYAASILPRDSSVYVSSFSICLLLIATAVLVCSVVAVKGSFPFGRIYYLAIALLLVAVLSPAVFSSSPIVLSILCLAVVHFLTMLYRCILSYVVFQSGADPVRVFGFGMAAISLGSLIGNTIGSLLVGVDPAMEILYPLSFSMVLLCIFAAFFLFPEAKMKTLLLPVDEPALDSLEEKAGHAKWWMETAEVVASQGGLSEREREVFYLLVRGKSTQQIADKLFVSPYTVKAHTRSIYAKLDVHSRTELNDYVEKRARKA